MKKTSKSLSLLLMGSLAAALGGCGSDETVTEEFRAYSSLDECVKEQLFTPDECRDLAIAAIQQNPKFGSLEECEKKFGQNQCRSYEAKDGNREGGSSWMPLIMGYMAGRYLGGGSMMQSAQPLYGQPGSQPGARSFRTLDGTSVQPDARGVVNKPSESLRKGFSKSAKPYAIRSGGVSSRGGFTGVGAGS